MTRSRLIADAVLLFLGILTIQRVVKGDDLFLILSICHVPPYQGSHLIIAIIIILLYLCGSAIIVYYFIFNTNRMGKLLVGAEPQATANVVKVQEVIVVLWFVMFVSGISILWEISKQIFTLSKLIAGLPQLFMRVSFSSPIPEMYLMLFNEWFPTIGAVVQIIFAAYLFLGAPGYLGWYVKKTQILNND